MVTFEYRNIQLQLPSPQQGDTESIKLRTKIYRAMDATIWSYIASPTQQTLRLTFQDMNRPKVLEAFKFFKFSAGSPEIIYTDYDNVKWRGTILSNPIESTHVAPRNNTFTLEFEGIIIDDSALNTTATASFGDTIPPSDTGDGADLLEH